MNIYVNSQQNCMLYHYFPLVLWRVEANETYHVMNRNFAADRRILIGTKSGQGRIVTQSGSYCVKAGSLFLLTRGELISYGTSGEEWSFDWAEFMTDAPLPSLALSRDQNASQNFENLYRSLVAQKTQSAASYLSLLCSSWQEKADTDPESGILSVKYYIDCLPMSSQMTVSELADHFYISERTLRYQFEKEFHQSPKEYMLQKKMMAVQNLLLTTDLSVQVVSEMAGFNSVYYFSKAFKSYTGYSPSAFRQYIEQENK